MYTIPQHRTPGGIICGYAGTLSMSGQCPTCDPLTDAEFDAFTAAQAEPAQDDPAPRVPAPLTFANGAPLDIAAAEATHRRMYPAAYDKAKAALEDQAAKTAAILADDTADMLAAARRTAAAAHDTEDMARETALEAVENWVSCRAVTLAARRELAAAEAGQAALARVQGPCT